MKSLGALRHWYAHGTDAARETRQRARRRGLHLHHPNCRHSGTCDNLDVGEPQNGQTPDGRLSDVAQTVNWRVDPRTYGGGTFDITVTWQVDLATSTSNLWTWEFLNLPNNGNTGPTGYCNQFGCSCGIQAASATTTVAHTFKVPIPATQCPS